ncbi:MAG: exodeoxyribonuclease III [Saprospiraceae bacterium]|nr:exodeoxyribonuclease III [Saprospiraceae bacterium]
MKIATLNANGIRSASGKDLWKWVLGNKIDILGLQETKIHERLVNSTQFDFLHLHDNWFSAQKEGYSGVATFSGFEPKSVLKGMNIEVYDIEGRVLRTDFENFILVNVYIPSGSSGEHRHDFKMKFLPDFQDYIESIKKENENLIVLGDYNIVHQGIDIHNPDRKDNPSGYRHDERKWLDQWFQNGFYDAFRLIYPDKKQFSWWSYRAGSFKKNLGWRIDYISVSENLKDKVRDVSFFTDTMFSDHCPVIMDIDL